MKNMSSIFFCLIMVSALGMANPPDKQFNIEEYGNILKFEGIIFLESVTELEKHLRKNFDTIEINSRGGDISAALVFAKLIKDKGTNLIVDQYCLSSCANYLFLAAKEKTLRPGAILGFHGGYAGAPIQLIKPSDLSKTQGFKRHGIAEKEVLNGLNKLAEKVYKDDVEFYKTIAFDPEFLQVSVRKALKDTSITDSIQLECRESEDEKKVPPYNLTCNGFSPSVNTFFFPNQTTLLKYGAHGIKDYPYPKDAAELEKNAHDIETKLGITVIGDF